MNKSFEDFERRKKDHIRLALDSISQAKSGNDFSHIKLIHNALPEINFEDVHVETQLLGQAVSSPHFVSSMTAGHEKSFQINLNLAKAAEKRNWLMAVGSQRRELMDVKADSEWTKIKQEVPHAKLISNIGILQLIQEPTEKILNLTKAIDAVGLIVHLNPLQEVIQNPKSAHFKNGLKAIESFVKHCSIPVIIKEVGFGLNHHVVETLFSIGVKVVDLAGKGGTHWGIIEAVRNQKEGFGLEVIEPFNEWGFSSVELLLEMQERVLFNPIWASGGVRSGVDSAKCLALGARAVGIAQPLMKAALESATQVETVMQQFDDQLKIAMFCSGVQTCEGFLHKKVWQCR